MSWRPDTDEAKLSLPCELMHHYSPRLFRSRPPRDQRVVAPLGFRVCDGTVESWEHEDLGPPPPNSAPPPVPLACPRRGVRELKSRPVMNGDEIALLFETASPKDV